MKPEEEARQKIGELLVAAGWVVQDLKQLNLGAGRWTRALASERGESKQAVWG